MRLRVALPVILLILLSTSVQSSLLAQSSGCTGREAQIQLRSTNPLYVHAMDVARRLIDHGFVVKCVLPSKMENLFNGQKGAVLYRTDRGDFNVLFLPEAETFDAVELVEQKQGERYIYSFRGTPHSTMRMYARKTYFINSGNLLFVVMDDADLAVSIEAAASNSCPVTKPPSISFIPPSPYPTELPAGSFWFGTENLWTILPMDGTWKGLLHYRPADSAFRNKLFWWHEGYDWRAETAPNLTVTGRRLDAPAPPLATDEHADAGWTNDENHAFMVAGIFIPAIGCWQITGDYKGQRLTFVVSVRQ
jgi:hypothetical protein